jgi:putative NADPH-quinone reductase
MNVSLILAHPERGSFNHAIAHAAAEQIEKNGHVLFFHDLYEEGFDPLLPGGESPQDGPLTPVVRKHCKEISEAGGIVIVHPNWWGQPPAILKGWIDRVLRPGVAYTFEEGDAGEGVPRGLHRAGAAVVFNTSNTAPERERKAFGDPLEAIWRHCIFGLCGINRFHRRTFGIVITSTLSERQQWLAEVRQTMNSAFPNIPP